MILFSNGFSQQNIAIGKRASASNTHNTTSTSNLVDGNYNTPWNAGASATQWISIDLQDNYTISSIKLIPCQSPAGNTTHEILVTSDNNSWNSIDKFTVYSSDKSPIERKFSTPINNVKSIKVITSQSPSWIAWFEIEIYGSKTISNVTTNTTGVFTDLRDNKVYKTVKIGNQTWMAENLAYEAIRGCWAYDNNSSNVSKYGYLYNWETAKNVCPSGWHLPSDTEWTTLTNNLGGEEVAGKKLKSATGWELYEGKNYGNNESGFKALPGGYRDYLDGTFGLAGTDGYWWGGAPNGSEHAWIRGLYYSNGRVYRDADRRASGYSVRCLKD